MAIRNILFDIIIRGQKGREELKATSAEFNKTATAADKTTKGTLEYEEATKRAATANKQQSTAMRKAGSDANSMRNQIKRARGEMAATQKQGGGLAAMLGKVGIAFGAIQLLSFARDAGELAAEAQGVARAFERLPNSVEVLKSLQVATKGTVSELELMRAAVRAEQFGLPIEELGNLFAFAKSRADDTGESVDVLVDKIVRGIGRKSVLILDDLGISASQVKDALGGVAVESASVAEITQAVGKIASEAMGEIGEQALTDKNKIEQLAVVYQDFKLVVGDLVLELTGGLGPSLATGGRALVEFFKNINIERVQLFFKGLLNLGKAYLALKAAQIGVRALFVINNALMAGARVASLTLAVAQNVLAGNSVRAAAAIRLLTAAVLSNPFTLLIGSLVAITPLLFSFIRGTEEGAGGVKQLTREQELLNNAQASYNKALKGGIAEAKTNFALLKETNAGTQERKRLIEDINSEYGTTLKNLDDEAAFARQLDAAYQGVVNSLKQKIALQIREEQLKPLIEEQIRLEEELAAIQGVVADNMEAQGDVDNFKPFADGVKGVAREYFNLQAQLNENLGLQQSLLNLDFINKAAVATKTLTTAAAGEASDILKGSIAAIKGEITALEKQRDQQIQLFIDGAINLEAFRRITTEIELERKRLNDALLELSPVEPYKAQVASVEEISREIASIEQAIIDTQAKGFLTPELEARLGEARAKLKEAQEEVRQLTISAQLELEEEEVRHQQELIGIRGEAEDAAELNDERRLENERRRNGEILALEIGLLERRLELLREQGTLTELEEEKINNRLEELRLQRQFEGNRKQLEAHKAFLEEWKELEFEQRADLFARVEQAAFSLAQTLTQIQIDQLQQLTSLQEQRVSEAVRLAEEGNVTLLKAEQERLDELNRQRAQFVRAQQALAAAELVANSAVAITKAAAQGGVAAPFTIAATLLALGAGLAQARQLASQAAFKDGVIDYQGRGTGTSDSNVVRISHGESVITAKGTDKAPRLLELVNEGRITDGVFNQLLRGRDLAVMAKSNSARDGGRQMDVKELREIRDILRGQKSNSLSLNPHHLTQLVERRRYGKKRIITRL